MRYALCVMRIASRSTLAVMVGQLPTQPRCPACGAVNDGYLAPEDPTAAPSDGDLSLCAYCHAGNVFVVNAFGWTTLRRTTPAELLELRSHFPHLKPPPH